jgi:hypothetical protein
MDQGSVLKIDTYGVEGPELRVQRAGHSGSQNPVIFALCYLPFLILSSPLVSFRTRCGFWYRRGMNR